MGYSTKSALAWVSGNGKISIGSARLINGICPPPSPARNSVSHYLQCSFKLFFTLWISLWVLWYLLFNWNSSRYICLVLSSVMQCVLSIWNFQLDVFLPLKLNFEKIILNFFSPLSFFVLLISVSFTSLKMNCWPLL